MKQNNNILSKYKPVRICSPAHTYFLHVIKNEYMKKFIIGIITMIFFIGCTSQTEKKGIKDIADFYGCKVSYSIGSELSTKYNSKKYFELKLSESDYLNSIHPDVAASNSALIFYRSLSDGEKSNYSHIKCVIEQNSNKTTKVEFKTQNLEIVAQQLYLFQKCKSLFQKKEYNKVIDIFEPEIKKTINNESISLEWDKIDKDYGLIKDGQIHGFFFINPEFNGKILNLLEIKGLLIRENDNTNFNVIVSQDVSDKYIYGINFNN